jgi:hypothetical protein
MGGETAVPAVTAHRPEAVIRDVEFKSNAWRGRGHSVPHGCMIGRWGTTMGKECVGRFKDHSKFSNLFGWCVPYPVSGHVFTFGAEWPMSDSDV